MGLLRARLLIRGPRAPARAAVALLLAAGGADLAASSDPAPTPASGPVTVRFAEPGSTTLLQGPTRITIEAATSPDARIVSVTLYADDRLLSVIERAPYTLTWDAGPGLGIRRLRAVALDSSGRTAEATLVTRRLPVGEYAEVRLVTLYAAVRDARGRPVLDLDRSDFAVSEDGVPQTVTHFSAARAPITIALLLDTSASMRLGGRIELARRAAGEFLDAVEPEDRLLVLNFDDLLHGDRVPAADRASLRQRIEAVTTGGGTALYDALYQTAGLLQEADGRRAIVLLSDGRDQALAENEPGSLHLFEEALERAHRADVVVYAIGLGRHLDEEMDLAHRRSLRDILETLATQTGGRAWFPERPADLAGVYRQVASDLKDQYTLAYSPVNETRDGRWRAIRVEVRRGGLAVRSRAGYYAPGPAGRP